MGIKGLFLECPGGTGDDLIVGFSNLSHLRNKANPADLDSGTLLYTCAWSRRDEYNAGNYIPAVRQFKQQILFMTVVYKWDFTMIFDGCPPPEKAHEHERRKDKEGGLRITSTYKPCAKKSAKTPECPTSWRPKRPTCKSGGRTGLRLVLQPQASAHGFQGVRAHARAQLLRLSSRRTFFDFPSQMRRRS